MVRENKFSGIKIKIIQANDREWVRSTWENYFYC